MTIELKLDKLILFGCILLTLQGCFLIPNTGPGYYVSISVKTPDFKTEILALTENIAFQEQFLKKRSVKEDRWSVVHYYREFTEKEAQMRGGKFIDISVSYDSKMEQLRVKVDNIAQGHNENLKNEIERIASIYIKNLSDIYGKDNLQINRGRTGLGL